jgi:hypothetical protein
MQRSHLEKSFSSPGTGGFSPEQLAFLQRKNAEKQSYGTQAASASIPVASASATGFSPEQLAFLERKNAEKQSYGAHASAPAASASVTGFSPEQLAFMERKNAQRRSAPSHSWNAGPALVSEGFAPGYAPFYAPSYAGAPQLDATPASPNVGSILGAALMGMFAGIGVTLYVVRFRRSASTTSGYLHLTA